MSAKLSMEMNYLEASDRSPLTFDEFERKDCILYHLGRLHDRMIRQLVIPKSLCEDPLGLHLAPPLATHSVLYRTYTTLRNTLRFLNLTRECSGYVVARCVRRYEVTCHAKLKWLWT